MTSSPLIGRDHPVALLRAEIDRLLVSHGGLVLVSGEAGIGKTTLVAEVAADAERRGARVLTGSCWPGDAAPGHWPWIQVVRNLARTATPEEWRAASAAAGDERQVLLGERALAAGPASDRSAFRLQDALTTLLVTAARTRPIVVVLDDLHWADPASVLMLEFLVRHAWFEPVLVIGTYRDVELDVPEHPLRPHLAPLLSRAATLRLVGLDLEGVAALIARTTGRAPEPEVVSAVHRRTGGNPFFVEQTARLDPGARPATGVREAVDQRLSMLPPAVVDVLSCASVIGHEFDAGLLAAVAGTPDGRLDELLAPALATHLVLPERGSRYAFTHDLVRECLYAALPDTRRREVHAAVIRSLDVLPGTAAAPAIVAHHTRLAVPALPKEEAVERLLAAARDAGGRRAAEEATRHLRAALALLPDNGCRRRAGVLLELGDQLDRAGELEAARSVFAEVAATGRRLDDAELVARAALGRQRLGNPDPDTRHEIDLMDEACRLLERGPVRNPTLTARALAAASMARTHLALEEDAAAELSTRAVALARSHADDETLGWCLLAHHDSIWEPRTAAAREDLLDELTAAARRASDRDLEALASFLRTLALLEQGRSDAVDEFAAFTALTEQTRLPRHRYLALSRSGAFATLTGRFEPARAAVDDALALGEHVGEVDRQRMWRDQVWALHLLRGDVAAALATARSTPGDPFVTVLEGFTATHRGDADRALRRREEIEELFAGLPRRFTRMRLVFDAQLAAATGDPELCAVARAELAPVVSGWAVFSGGGVVWGPMALWAAAVSAAEQRWDEAVDGCTAAIEAANRLGARPWVVLARAHLAAALRGRQGNCDAGWAAEVLVAARREADELGMAAALEPSAAPTAVGQRPAYGNVFRFDGQVWTLRFAGRTVHVRDAKGLHDLSVLLARPGADIAAADLLNPTGEPTVAARRRFGADPVIDERARTAYRDRLGALDADIRNALDSGADRRAAELDQERVALVEELRRAAGLGGRPRRLGDETERARQAVTARIRDTLKRLRSAHPELADHLAMSISTGSHCRYRPEPLVTWST
jgi:MoxR-like ATPase